MSRNWGTVFERFKGVNDYVDTHVTMRGVQQLINSFKCSERSYMSCSGDCSYSYLIKQCIPSVVQNQPQMFTMLYLLKSPSAVAALAKLRDTVNTHDVFMTVKGLFSRAQLERIKRGKWLQVFTEAVKDNKKMTMGQLAKLITIALVTDPAAAALFARNIVPLMSAPGAGVKGGILKTLAFAMGKAQGRQIRESLWGVSKPAPAPREEGSGIFDTFLALLFVAFALWVNPYIKCYDTLVYRHNTENQMAYVRRLFGNDPTALIR